MLSIVPLWGLGISAYTIEQALKRYWPQLGCFWLKWLIIIQGSNCMLFKKLTQSSKNVYDGEIKKSSQSKEPFMNFECTLFSDQLSFCSFNTYNPLSPQSFLHPLHPPTATSSLTLQPDLWCSSIGWWGTEQWRLWETERTHIPTSRNTHTKLHWLQPERERGRESRGWRWDHALLKRHSWRENKLWLPGTGQVTVTQMKSAFLRAAKHSGSG